MEFQCIFVWSSKLNCLPHQLTSYFSHGFDTDPFCLLLCDVELPLWGFVDMKLYRKCLVLNKCHFQCVISDLSGLLTVVPLRLGGEICSGHITTILQYLNVSIVKLLYMWLKIIKAIAFRYVWRCTVLWHKVAAKCNCWKYFSCFQILTLYMQSSECLILLLLQSKAPVKEKSN